MMKPKHWTLYGTLEGLEVTIKHFLGIGKRKIVTVQYPYERIEPAQRFRGLHSVHIDRCVGCGICEGACPNRTITIVKHTPGEPDETPANVFHLYPQFNEEMCMFCGLCVDACPMSAIDMTGKYELAEYDRSRFVYGPDRILIKKP